MGQSSELSLASDQNAHTPTKTQKQMFEGQCIFLLGASFLLMEFLVNLYLYFGPRHIGDLGALSLFFFFFFLIIWLLWALVTIHWIFDLPCSIHDL